MQFAFIVFTIIAGVMSGLESGSNNTLQKGLNAPWWTIVVVSTVTLVASLASALIARDRFPDSHSIGSVAWYGWIGGLFALVFVASTVFASPKLGAGLFIAIVVTSSTVTSLVLDHYGLMKFPVHEANWGRIAGAALMIMGVALIGIF